MSVSLGDLCFCFYSMQFSARGRVSCRSLMRCSFPGPAKIEIKASRTSEVWTHTDTKCVHMSSGSHPLHDFIPHWTLFLFLWYNHTGMSHFIKFPQAECWSPSTSALIFLSCNTSNMSAVIIIGDMWPGLGDSYLPMTMMLHQQRCWLKC